MEVKTMKYAYLQLHAPAPPEPRDRDETRPVDNSYPDFEQNHIFEQQDEDETRRVVVIEI
tara:strand:+ start:257 stop:436 length:180 start_codon:yes stop_codon:yes gene_type:complete